MRTMREVLEAARKRRVGIGHFNFTDLTSLRAVVSAARQMDVPVVVGVSEGEREFIGVRQAAALVRSFREEYGVSIFLNADHTHSLRNAEEAAHAGFDEILFDGSGLPFDKNVSETKRAVEA